MLSTTDPFKLCAKPKSPKKCQKNDTKVLTQQSTNNPNSHSKLTTVKKLNNSSKPKSPKPSLIKTNNPIKFSKPMKNLSMNTSNKSHKINCSKKDSIGKKSSQKPVILSGRR